MKLKTVWKKTWQRWSAVRGGGLKEVATQTVGVGSSAWAQPRRGNATHLDGWDAEEVEKKDKDSMMMVLEELRV